MKTLKEIHSKINLLKESIEALHEIKEQSKKERKEITIEIYERQIDILYWVINK